MSGTAFIVLAAGSGTRFSAEKPKQLAMLAGKTILQHTLENIVSCPSVSQIILVSNPSILKTCVEIAQHLGGSRIKVVAGGSSRLESTLLGLRAIQGTSQTKVLIHDGVRPFLKHQVIDACYSQLDYYDAVDVVIPSADTIIKTEDGVTISSIPPRATFRRGQTPQGFWLEKILSVLEELGNLEGASFTDDCGMYLSRRPDATIGLVHGDESNLKITYPLDLFIAEQLMMSGQVGKEAASSINLSSIHKMNIVVFGDNSGLGKDAAQALRKIGASVYGISRSSGCDVGNYQQVANFLSDTATKCNQIDAILNFAGVLHVGKLAEIEYGDLMNVIQTNYTGSLNIARCAHEHLRKSSGQLILVSSSSYYKGRADYAAYSSSKSAIVNLTQALSEEWMEDGIRVNCVVPRRANTPMRRAAFPNEDESSLLKPEQVSLEVINLLKSNGSGGIRNVY